MNLPKGIKEAGKQAIQSLWDDTLSVWRSDENGHVKEFVQVYADVRCHLCGAEPTIKQGEQVATADTRYTVHFDGVEIIPGDELEVTHQGKKYKGAAGIPFPRSFCIVVPMTGVVIT